jgi:pimeloyl-ACP methyl ester carboxylesterase
MRAILTGAVRPTPTRLAAFVDSMAMPATASRLREDPWRIVVDQFVDGTISYRRRFNEPRPVPAKLDALIRSTLPVLVIIGKDETLHDGPTMAARFTDQLPHAQVELLDQANHLVFIDQQEQVERLLRHFLTTAPDTNATTR